MQHTYNALPKDQIGVTWVCVRFYPRDTKDGSRGPFGPTVHANGAHSAMGQVTVGVNPDNGWLRLRIHDLPAGAGIGMITVTPDETLTMIGATFGPSGGNDLTNFRVSIGDPTRLHGRRALDLRIPEHYDKLAGPLSNIWIKLEHDLSAVGANQ